MASYDIYAVRHKETKQIIITGGQYYCEGILYNLPKKKEYEIILIQKNTN